MNRLASLSLTLLAFASALPAVQAEDVLFVGNSYTYGGGDKAVSKIGVPGLVAAIAKAKGQTLDFRAVTQGGKGLDHHLAQPATAETVASRPWDWLVLQDLSLRHAKPEGLARHLEDAEAFYRLFREKSPQGRVILYQTWPRGPLNTMHRGAPDGPEKMFHAIRDLYSASAEKLEAIDPGEQVLVAPVGAAFMLCLNRHPKINLYAEDHHHASARGSYLSALVIYATLFKADPVGAPHVFPGVEITAEDAALLQRVAAEVAAP